MELKYMTQSTPLKTVRGLKLAALALGSALLLTACAGTPPSEQFAVSRAAVNSAVSAGGTEFAPVEMRAAQEKLNKAEAAIFEKRYDDAKRLAQQAEWDARVAERKAQATKAEKAVEDAKQGIQELREESQRNIN